MLRFLKKNNKYKNEEVQGSELLQRRDSIGVAYVHKSTVNANYCERKQQHHKQRERFE